MFPINADKSGFDQESFLQEYNQKLGITSGINYQTKKDCIDDCLLDTDWKKVEY